MNQETTSLLTKKHGSLFCTLCEKSFIDTTTFTEHLQSSEHIAKSGTNQQFKTVTVNDIRTRLALLKEKKREEKMSQKDREDLRKEWKDSRKERKKEWKEKQKLSSIEKENDHYNEKKRSRSNSRERKEERNTHLDTNENEDNN